jgi:hypothetical protein
MEEDKNYKKLLKPNQVDDFLAGLGFKIEK